MLFKFQNKDNMLFFARVFEGYTIDDISGCAMQFFLK